MDIVRQGCKYLCIKCETPPSNLLPFHNIESSMSTSLPDSPTQSSDNNTAQTSWSRHVFVANLPMSARLADIESRVMAMLAPHGNIVTVRARLDKTNLPIAFVSFKEPVDVAGLGQLVFNYDGRRVRVEACRERPNSASSEGAMSPPLPLIDGETPPKPQPLQPVQMNKIIVSGVNTSVLSARHLLRRCAQFGRVMDIYLPAAGVPADPAILAPFTALIEFGEEGEAKRAAAELNDEVWAGWRVVAACTSMPLPFAD